MWKKCWVSKNFVSVKLSDVFKKYVFSVPPNNQGLIILFSYLSNCFLKYLFPKQNSNSHLEE